MTNMNSPSPKIRSAGGADKSVAPQTISRKRIRNALRQELRRLLVTPVRELAGLRVARLDAMIDRLVGRVLDGDLEAMDVVLTVVDTLGRHPAGTKTQRREPCSEKAGARRSHELRDVAAGLGPRKWVN